jgi:predicted nucleic acid-binding protein
MKTITINVSEPVYRDFAEYARRQDRTTSELIREAMEAYRDLRIRPRPSLKELRPLSLGSLLKPMHRGIDSTFLVQAEVLEHPRHDAARLRLEELLKAQDTLVLAPQVLAEFIHIVTDPGRFSSPLRMDQATERAESWWNAREVVHAFPDHESVLLFLRWMQEHRLGRKRLLDTLLAATFFSHGVRSILSSNIRDYGVFGCFEVITP